MVYVWVYMCMKYEKKGGKEGKKKREIQNGKRENERKEEKANPWPVTLCLGLRWVFPWTQRDLPLSRFPRVRREGSHRCSAADCHSGCPRSSLALCTAANQGTPNARSSASTASRFCTLRDGTSWARYKVQNEKPIGLFFSSLLSTQQEQCFHHQQQHCWWQYTVNTFRWKWSLSRWTWIPPCTWIAGARERKRCRIPCNRRRRRKAPDGLRTFSSPFRWSSSDIRWTQSAVHGVWSTAVSIIGICGHESVIYHTHAFLEWGHSRKRVQG